MERLARSLCMVFLVAASLATPVIAQESQTVIAEGVAAIQGNARDIARDAAIEDAQRRAVEQAIGLLIDSQTQVENYQLISDKILSQTRGYIKRYTVTSETVDSGLLRVRINADVAVGRLTDDLAGTGILLGRMHKPRTMIMIAEQNIGQEWYTWWWGHQGTQTDFGVVENTFTDVFTQKGFEFIDHGTASKVLTVTAAYRVRDLSETQARTLGDQVDAEVVIVGKALSRSSGDIGGGMMSAQADLTVRAVRIDTGQVIATASSHAAAVNVTEIRAGTEALQKAATEAAENLLGKILAIYAKETGGTRPVNITISGVNKTQFAKFKDVLLNQVRGIKDLHERGFNGTTAKISVDSKNSAQTVSDELLLKDFGSYTVEVVSSTANSLELKITQK